MNDHARACWLQLKGAVDGGDDPAQQLDAARRFVQALEGRASAAPAPLTLAEIGKAASQSRDWFDQFGPRKG